MYQHVLIIHSNQSEGRRIALHKSCQGIEDVKDFMSLNSRLNGIFEHLTFGFHHIQSVGKSIESIKEYDYFFDDMDFYHDYDEFVELIKDDITIKPIDIIKTILSKRDSSPLEIQKLMYFVYCEYLSVYGEELFSDDFEAWKYGPVIPEVYYSLQHHKSDRIKGYNDDDSISDLYSRMVKIPQYDKVVKVIDYTMAKYKDLDGIQLMKKTHVNDGPWDQIYQKGIGQNQIIPKNLIKEYVVMNEVNKILQ